MGTEGAGLGKVFAWVGIAPGKSTRAAPAEGQTIERGRNFLLVARRSAGHSLSNILNSGPFTRPSRGTGSATADVPNIAKSAGIDH